MTTLKKYVWLLSLGLLAGSFLVGMTWAQKWWFPDIPYTAFFIVFWVFVLGIIGFGLYLRKSNPFLSRLTVVAAVVVAVGMVYLLPNIFAPGSCGDGMPRAFAGCTETCVDVCTWWVDLGAPLPGGGVCTKTNPWDLGCCLRYRRDCTEECEDDDDPPSASGSVTCGTTGNNGWCRANGQLQMTASDPQGYTVTLNGSIAGVNFTCPAGTSCTRMLPEGSGNIQFRATSSSGLSSSWVNRTFQFDSVPPTILLVKAGTQGANNWYVSSVNVSGSGSDATSGLASAQVSLDSATWQSGSLSLGDGVHLVYFRATDVAGNVSSNSDTIRVDTTPPLQTLSVNSASSLGEYHTSNVTVQASASDSLSGVASIQYRVNGGVWQTGNSVTLSSDGEHVVTFRSTNGAGLSTTEARTIKIDKTSPAVAFLKVPENTAHVPQTWFNNPVSIGLNVTDSYSGVGVVEWHVTPPYTTWSPGASRTFSADGIHTLTVRAHDVAGNVVVTSTQVRVDRTPPQQSIAVSGTPGSGGYYVSGITVSAASSDATSGVQSVQYSVNGSTWTSGTSVSIVPDGSHTVRFRTRDNAGNETTGETTVHIDKTAPVANINRTGILGNNSWYTTSLSIQLVAQDETSGIGLVQYRIDNGDWVSGDSFTLQDGVYFVEARVIDNAGNQTNLNASLKVDTQTPGTNPIVTATSGSNGWLLSAASVVANPSDATSGVFAVENRVNGSNWKSGESVSITDDGVHTVEFRVTDNAGLQSVTSRIVRIDQTKPQSVFTTPADGSNDTVIKGTYQFTGDSVDVTSGVEKIEISFNGSPWQPVAKTTSAAWLYSWDSTKYPNGTYIVLVRATDVAGNIENTARVSVVVANNPPNVKLQDEWWIWESGSMSVKDNVIPIGEIIIRIACSPLQDVVVRFDDPADIPDFLRWDRRCGDGNLAESGEYTVSLTACDIFGNCASATGLIKIPFIVVPQPTWTPTLSPSPTVTITSDEEQPVTATPSPTPTIPMAISTPTPEPEPEPEVSKSPVSLFPWLLLFLGLTAASVWGSTSLGDPRPPAIKRLADKLTHLNSLREKSQQ